MLEIFAFTLVEMLRVVPVLSNVVKTFKQYFTLNGMIKQVIKFWILQHIKAILLTFLIVTIMVVIIAVLRRKSRKDKNIICEG